MPQTLDHIQRLKESAKSGGRALSLAEIYIVEALALQAQDLTDEAADSVNKALELAEPENAVRLFLDKGPILPLLLKKAAKRNNQSVLLKRLLADGSNSSTPTKNSRQPEEPLSDRELDVLKLLSTELSGPEIARQLFVSLNTMRTHTKNIYSKLGVNSRRAAG